MTRHPKKAWAQLASTAEYTARMARALSEGKGITDETDLIQKTKNSVRRQNDQIECIMRYLIKAQHAADPSCFETELKQDGQPFARYTRNGDQVFLEERMIRAGRQIDCQASRTAISEAFCSRFGDDDPDWIGESLCDLKMCSGVKEFLIWGELHGMDVKEQLRYTEKKEWTL